MRNLHRMSKFALLSIFLLIAGGCTIPIPVTPMAGVTPALATPATATPEAATEATATQIPGEGAAMATIATRSLRVRQGPSEDSEVIGGVAEGEQYKVIGISPDGQWVELAIDSVPGGQGWVSAGYVTVEGTIAGATTLTETVPMTETTPMTETETMTQTMEVSPTETAPMTETVPMTSTETMPAAEATPTAETAIMTATMPVTETMPATETMQSSEGAAIEGTPTANPTPAPGFAVVTTDGTRLRVRSEPNADSEIVGYVYNGESYKVLEISPDGAWVKIAGSDAANTDNPNGGWVSSEYVVIGQ